MNKKKNTYQLLSLKSQNRKRIITFFTILCLCGASTSIGAAPKENDKSPAASPTPVESENPITALEAHTLYTLRNPYVGDASANGKLPPSAVQPAPPPY